ncbi:MAG: glycosyltransferase [Fervidobacterium sp.]
MINSERLVNPTNSVSKKYLIATACNEKYEKFLINHWLRSLEENVNLSNIDILVLDFGLSENTSTELEKHGVLIIKVEKLDGHINNIRFRELKDFLLKSSKYKQVILCDSGDIIFQADISRIFEIEQSKVKGVIEQISPNMDIVVSDKVQNSSEIKKFLKGKKLVNAGFVVYPTEVFTNIVEDMFKLIKDPYAWGVDMVLLNYFIYQIGFHSLPVIYNFIPTTATEKYLIRDGKFYLSDGTIIPVVHNAGGKRFLRPIKNFGYGQGYNQPRQLVISILRTFYKTLSYIRV